MRAAFAILLLAVFSACGNEGTVPKEVLAPPKMAKVLWDVIRADEAANHQFRMDTLHNLFRESTTLYQSVFKLHGVTDSAFKQSFRYYQGHPDKMKVLLDSVDALAKRPTADTLKKY